MFALISVQEAAKRKGVSVSCVYKAIKRGEISVVRVLGRLGINEEDLEKFDVGSYAGVTRTSKKRGPGRARIARKKNSNAR